MTRPLGYRPEPGTVRVRQPVTGVGLEVTVVGTVSLVTAVLAVSVSVTLVVGVSALSLAGAAELRGQAHLGRTGSLVTEVITVRDLVTLPGLGDAEAGTEAAELLLAAGLVRGDLDDNLVRIVSTVICSIMFLLAWDTPSVIAPEL